MPEETATVPILSTMCGPGDGRDVRSLGRSAGVVQVWWASWQGEIPAPAAADSWYRLLDASERRRCGRLGMADDKLQYIAAHGLLRTALSSGTGVPAEQWRFRVREHGRPEVAEPVWAGDIRFSLSHTRGLVACAVGVGLEVGLDVERILDNRAIHEAGELFLAEPERTDCQALAPADRTRRLYEYWTLKEAFAKAMGLGLALPPESAAFELDGRGGARVRCDAPAAGEGWRFSVWAPTPRHCMAAAIRGRGRQDLTVIQRRCEVFA